MHNHILTQAYTMLHSPMYTQPYTHPCIHNHTLTHICTTTHAQSLHSPMYTPSLHSPMYAQSYAHPCIQTRKPTKPMTIVNTLLLQTGEAFQLTDFCYKQLTPLTMEEKNKICTRQTGSSSHTHMLSMLLKMACSQKNTR